MSNIIKRYLADQKYDTASDETYEHIDEWLDWYQNDVDSFHKYNVWNGSVMTSHRRYTMGMAKKICEDWANLLLNEKVSIKAGEYTERLNEILTFNNFSVRSNQLIELAYALGTGAFVEYKDSDGNVIIDYIRADMIYPLSWDNGDITECAFGTTRVVGGKERIYLQIHRFGRICDEEDGEDLENTNEYYIENRYVDAESGKEIDAPYGIIPKVSTGYTKALFQIITPNICNNIDMDSPLGVSVYANSISQLKGCDLVYDSYMNEYILGRKRILVPISSAKMIMAEDGISTPLFDPNDTVYYQLPSDRNNEMKLTEIDMKIRATDHELGIQRCLDIMSMKAGMGTGRYKFESGGVKTATEVISDKSDLYQSRQKNCIVIREAIISMVRAVSFLDIGREVDATVDFDDSIIEDTNTTIDRNIKLVTNGLRSKVTAIMEIYHCSESDAKKELERIREDESVKGQDVDWTDMDDNDPDDDPDEEKDDVDDESITDTAGGGDGR